MKVISLFGHILKWFFILLIILFSLAVFMGKNYGQGVALVVVTSALIYWPKYFKEKWGRRNSIIFRTFLILVLLSLNFTVFKPHQKTSIYTSSKLQNQLENIYNEKVGYWPADTQDKLIQTKYGMVHLLICGSEENPPLVMLHAASMGAHSWADNLEPLLEHHRIYAIDNIGEGNKSQLNDASIFPQNGKEIADLYSSLLDSLKIERAPVFGASNGGYIAQILAYYHPEKVKSLALFGPMGLTPLNGNSIFMLAVASMYPFQFVRNSVTKWALGEDKYCSEKYGDWFNVIMKATIPSVAKPVPMTTSQKHRINIPILLFLGTEDRIVGDADVAKKTALEYPNIRIEILESGHLIAVEQRIFVNQKLKEFLTDE